MNKERYLKCETITGEWWYKDLQTGEDLPMYSTPIRGLEEEPLVLTRWQEPTIDEKDKEIERLNNIINELEKHLHQEILEWQNSEDNWIKAQVQEDKVILDKLKELKEGR